MSGMVTCVTHRAIFPAGFEDDHKSGPCGEQSTAGSCVFSGPGTYVHPADPRRDHDIALAVFHGEAARDMHAAGLPHDTEACGIPHR